MKKNQWAVHIKNYYKSGQTKRAYALEHGLVYNQFLYYMRLLEAQDQSDTEFVEAVIESPVKSSKSRLSDTVEYLGILEFPGGARLLINSPDLLAQLPEPAPPFYVNCHWRCCDLKKDHRTRHCVVNYYWLQ